MAENKALTGATVYTGDEIIAGKAVLIEEDIITAVTEPHKVPDGFESIDCSGSIISAGFIDLQIAGAAGQLFSSNPSSDALKTICSAILNTGTTSFLLVLPTNSQKVYIEAMDAIRSSPHPALLGLHMEGPFINPDKRGAHLREFIRKPNIGELHSMLMYGRGIIKMVTLAPEVCFPEFIQALTDQGIVVCAGHSNATFSEALSGFEWGIRATTHLFNAMSPFHHRDPGLPGATYQTEGIMASIVADGIHVDFNTISVSKKVMKERLYLISDAVVENRAGAYQHVRQKDRFTLPDGTLSGSDLTMMKAVKNCVDHAGIPLEEALRMANLYPARLMGLNDRGAVRPGLKADLVVFDRNFKISLVLKNGSPV